VNQAAKRLTREKERGSRGQGRAPEPRYLIVGQVVGAHGVRGELKVVLLTDDPHRFRSLARVFIGLGDEEPVARPLKGYRPHKGNALLRIEACDDRATAEGLRGMLIQVPLAEAIPLEEGEYFEHQILDLAVWTADGQLLGQVADIIHTGANEVYVVRSADPDRAEVLIPAIRDVVLEVDLEAGRLIVELPEGLL
jgi:16S rRNA processing protein RimM